MGDYKEYEKRQKRIAVRRTLYKCCITHKYTYKSKFHEFGRSVTGPHQFSIPSITRQANPVPRRRLVYVSRPNEKWNEGVLTPPQSGPWKAFRGLGGHSLGRSAWVGSCLFHPLFHIGNLDRRSLQSVVSIFFLSDWRIYSGFVQEPHSFWGLRFGLLLLVAFYAIS